jgi:DNA-binding transcriptional ArsR family regulator
MTPRRAANTEAEESSVVFAALGDQTRFGLVSRLSSQGPLSITKLTEGFPVSRQAITKHLRVLERAGVVRSVAEGRELVWHVEQRRLAQAKRDLDAIARQWEGTLQRLKKFLED